jgi:hypothetical protein
LPGDDPDAFGTLSTGTAVVEDEVGAGVSRELKGIAQNYESIFTKDEADDVVFKPDERWNMWKLSKRVRELLSAKKVSYLLSLYFLMRNWF